MIARSTMCCAFSLINRKQKRFRQCVQGCELLARAKCLVARSGSCARWHAGSRFTAPFWLKIAFEEQLRHLFGFFKTMRRKGFWDDVQGPHWQHRASAKGRSAFISFCHMVQAKYKAIAYLFLFPLNLTRGAWYGIRHCKCYVYILWEVMPIYIKPKIRVIQSLHKQLVNVYWHTRAHQLWRWRLVTEGWHDDTSLPSSFFIF